MLFLNNNQNRNFSKKIFKSIENKLHGIDYEMANEYLLWYWYPYYRPTCLKGHSIPQTECLEFELIGRRSR